MIEISRLQRDFVALEDLSMEYELKDLIRGHDFSVYLANYYVAFQYRDIFYELRITYAETLNNSVYRLRYLWPSGYYYDVSGIIMTRILNGYYSYQSCCNFLLSCKKFFRDYYLKRF